MNFKEEVRNILESYKIDDRYSWNKYIPTDAHENKTTFIEEINDLIKKARKAGTDELPGLILARKIYIKHAK